MSEITQTFVFKFKNYEARKAFFAKVGSWLDLANAKEGAEVRILASSTNNEVHRVFLIDEALVLRDPFDRLDEIAYIMRLSGEKLDEYTLADGDS